jgi:hypothetical protein
VIFTWFIKDFAFTKWLHSLCRYVPDDPVKGKELTRVIQEELAKLPEDVSEAEKLRVIEAAEVGRRLRTSTISPLFFYHTILLFCTLLVEKTRSVDVSAVTVRITSRVTPME